MLDKALNNKLTRWIGDDLGFKRGMWNPAYTSIQGALKKLTPSQISKLKKWEKYLREPIEVSARLDQLRLLPKKKLNRMLNRVEKGMPTTNPIMKDLMAVMPRNQIRKVLQKAWAVAPIAPALGLKGNIDE